MRRWILTAFVALVGTQSVFGAVGCTLNNPDRDIKRLFRKATNYKTEFISIKEHGGEELAKEIEAKLKDKLEPRYESLDVPYAYYTVLSRKETIGYVHGVNQKGMYGGLQLILATDPNGKILDFYYQKISSPESKRFRDKQFTKQFVGLTLAEFYKQDLTKKIKDPSKKSAEDYLATLRGVKKNLILHDEFKLNNKYDKHFHSEKKDDNNENKNEQK
jgi:hypothetical protein